MTLYQWLKLRNPYPIPVSKRILLHAGTHTHTRVPTPGPARHSYLVLHLEVLHEAEVSEHADCAQGRLQVGQLEVTEAELGDLKGLG